jgi:hypothetical protein
MINMAEAKMDEMVSEVRTVQRSGKSNFLYLPLNWLRKMGMPKELHLKEDEMGVLNISPEKVPRKIREKTIKLTEYEFEFVNRLLMWAYFAGYDKFTLELPQELKSEEVFKHKKQLDEFGFSLDLLDVGKKSISFYVTQAFVSPKVIFNNLVNKALNYFRAKALGENKSLVKQHWLELRKSRYLLRRLFLIATQNPSLLKEEGLTILELYAFDNVGQHLAWLSDVDITKDAAEHLKRATELISAYVSKRDIKYLAELEEVIRIVKSAAEKTELKRISRYLLCLFLA